MINFSRCHGSHYMLFLFKPVGIYWTFLFPSSWGFFQFTFIKSLLSLCATSHILFSCHLYWCESDNTRKMWGSVHRTVLLCLGQYMFFVDFCLQLFSIWTFSYVWMMFIGSSWFTILSKTSSYYKMHQLFPGTWALSH